MDVLVTCKCEEDPIKNQGARQSGLVTADIDYFGNMQK